MREVACGAELSRLTRQQAVDDFEVLSLDHALRCTRRILLLTDRYIGLGEATARTRTLDYPFTLIDMTIDASGRGEGQLFIATKIMRTGNLLVLENFASTPVQLREIKRR